MHICCVTLPVLFQLHPAHTPAQFLVLLVVRIAGHPVVVIICYGKNIRSFSMVLTIALLFQLLNSRIVIIIVTCGVYRDSQVGCETIRGLKKKVGLPHFNFKGEF